MSFAGSVWADSAAWLGSAGPDWGADANWTAAHPDGTADVATFDRPSGNTTVTVGARALSKLVFTGVSLPSYTLNAGGLSVENGTIVELQSSVTTDQTINVHFALGGNGSNNPGITNASSSARLILGGNFTSTIAGTRSLSLGGNNAAVTEFGGNFSSPAGAIQMQVQNGTGIFSGTAAFSNFSVTNANNLIVDGSVSVNTTGVYNSSLLGGSGSLIGNVQVNPSPAGGRVGPIIAPGDPEFLSGANPGTLAVSGDLSVSNHSAPTTFRFRIGGASPGDGAGFYDQLDVGRAVSLGLDGDGNAPNSTLKLSLVNGYVPVDGTVVYLLARGDNAAFGTRTFAGLPEGASVSLGGMDGTLTYRAHWAGNPASSSFSGGNDVAIRIGAGGGKSDLVVEDELVVPAIGAAPARFSAKVSNGTPAASVRVEASRDLGNGDAWRTVATSPFDANGEVTFSNVPDPQSIGAARTYFRIAAP